MAEKTFYEIAKKVPLDMRISNLFYMAYVAKMPVTVKDILNEVKKWEKDGAEIQSGQEELTDLIEWILSFKDMDMN